MFRRLLVVCTANICRSPMAEAILRSKILHAGCSVASAGTNALLGREAARFTKEVMLEHGYDVGSHRAQQATEELLRSMDLIFTIDQTHTDWIVRSFPQLRGRVHKLGRWRGNVDVADPYGRDKKDYEEAYQLIDACVGDWLPHIDGGRTVRTSQAS